MTWISGIVMLAARNRSAEILDTFSPLDVAEFEIISKALPVRGFTEIETETGAVYMVGRDASGEIGIYDRALFADYLIDLRIKA